MRIQMLIVNKKWLTNGVEAFGPLVSLFSIFSPSLSLSLSLLFPILARPYSDSSPEPN